MCTNKLSDEKFKELDDFIQTQDGVSGSLISVLHKAQELFGYLPQEVQLHVSRKLKIPAAKVNGVVTFYSYFTEKPKGEHVISVCMGTACFVRGSEDLLKTIERKLNITAGETTSDGKYSIDALRCVGACGLAPVVIVDGKVFGRVKKTEINKILESYQ
jgi:NADH-quinone oxidoreductase subunit E